MRTLSVSAAVLACVLLSPPAPAQEAPAPPEQLQKLERLIGDWKGSGTVTMAPGAPSQSWTSTSRIRKVLGGHFLRDDTRIELESEGAPGPILFTTFYGFDRDKDRLFTCSINNMGGVDRTEVHWKDDDTMITTSAPVWAGEPTIQRWITKLTDKGYEFVGEEAIGDGPFFVHVKGVGERAAEVAQPRAVEAAFLPEGGNLPAEMAQVCRMAGKYEVAGTAVMGPGQPAVEFTATEELQPAFGGTILVGESKGDAPVEGAPPYEGWFALGWDAHEKCYRGIGLSSMGESHFPIAQWSGDNELVFVSSGPMRGTLTAGRFVLECDEDGSVTKGWGHSIFGTAAPTQDFQATYSKIE